MRAAARTFPVRAAASSSTSSFAPPPTSSSAQTASELGADFGAGADSDFGTGTGTGKASTRLCVPPATPAFHRSCFSRSISAVAREIKPVPAMSVDSRPPTSHPAEGTKASSRGHKTDTRKPERTRHAHKNSYPLTRDNANGVPRARFRRAGPRESGIRRAPSPTPPCRSP